MQNKQSDLPSNPAEHQATQQAELVSEITDMILNYTNEPIRIRVFGDDLHIDFTTKKYDHNTL